MQDQTIENIFKILCKASLKGLAKNNVPSLMRIYEVGDEAICSQCGKVHKDESTKYNAFRDTSEKWILFFGGH